jgi:hypothetical protein
MRAALFALSAFAMLCLSHAYQIEQSREALLAKYYAYVDPKIPKTARMLVGDERVNVYIGQSLIGLEVKRGELRSFEYAPLQDPSIVVIVSDSAAEKIENRSMGILEAIDSGAIRIITNNWFSAFKVEALKRAYAVSGIDQRLTDKSVKEGDIYNTNSLFMTRTRVAVWN